MKKTRRENANTPNTICWFPVGDCLNNPRRVRLNYQMILDLESINTQNFRPINWSRVSAYKFDMINRRWNEESHQGIAISKDFVLVDGQHRVLAAKMAMEEDPTLTAISFLIQWGVENTRGIDSGMARTVRQRTGISTEMITVSNFILNRICKISPVTDSQLELFCASDLSHAMTAVNQFLAKKRKYVGRAAIRAAASLRFPENEDYVLSQARSLSVLDFDSMSSSMKSFTRRIMSTDEDDYWLCARAWVAFDAKRQDASMVRVADYKPVIEEMRLEVKLPFDR